LKVHQIDLQRGQRLYVALIQRVRWYNYYACYMKI